MSAVFPVIEIAMPQVWLTTLTIVLIACVNATCEEMLWRKHLLGLLRSSGLTVRRSFGVHGARIMTAAPSGRGAEF